MLTVWRKAGKYDPARASAAAWIFTIARNRRIDLLRHERRPEIDPNDPELRPAAPEDAEMALAARSARRTSARRDRVSSERTGGGTGRNLFQ